MTVPAFSDYPAGRAISREAERLQSPFLLVDLDRVRRNLERIVELLDGDIDRWRPHLKSGKIPQIYDAMLDAGLRRFKCATTREAAVLLSRVEALGIEGCDLLIAYPLVGPGLRRAAALASQAPTVRLSVLCEEPDAVRETPPELSLFADVNVGMNRTGVPLADRERTLAIASAAGKRFRGLHAYDGHLVDPDPRRRAAAIHRCYDSLRELCRAMTHAGHPVPELITSGTPALPAAATYVGRRDSGAAEHRLSPGTVVLHDLRSAEQNPGIDLEPAALVASRVVSRPAADIVTCDAGSKALAVDAGDPCAAVVGHPGLEAQTPSEEHLPLRVTGGEPPKRGALLWLVPRHVCPTVNLYDEALIVDGGRLREIAPVSARGHELIERGPATPPPTDRPVRP